MDVSYRIEKPANALNTLQRRLWTTKKNRYMYETESPFDCGCSSFSVRQPMLQRDSMRSEELDSGKEGSFNQDFMYRLEQRTSEDLCAVVIQSGEASMELGKKLERSTLERL